MRKIDKMPPALTGNEKEDIRALQQYMVYLVEQLNWIITLLAKEGK